MIKLNGHEIKPTMFPDNTSQVWKIRDGLVQKGMNIFTWEFEHEAEFIHLAQLVDLVRYGYGQSKYRLELPYLPYGRQDKDYAVNSTFALRTFANLLNSLNFFSVNIRDAHSDIALDLIYDSQSYFMDTHLEGLVKEYDTICFPDKGACERYACHFPNHNIVTGDKTRDQQTGYILNYSFNGEVEGKRILIVDDICDGGMTFKILSEDLLENGAERVDLYVSHGLFTKGLQTLRDSGITKIYTPKGEQ